MKPTILTVSGLSFDLLTPYADLIKIEDIAHALSHICRFTGHTRGFYSVAEHSVHVSNLVPPEFALEALLHDATEAYIGDVSSPLKALLPDYRAIEAKLDAAVRIRFDLPQEQSPIVKHADLRMLATERADLMPFSTENWVLLDHVQAAPFTVFPPMLPAAAYNIFMQRFMDLTKDRP